MIAFLLMAVLLSIADPVGDTAGDGSLRPPTSGIYAGTASFDLQDVSLLDTPNLTLAITLGALDNPAELANGFSHPIIEIYLDSAPGGEIDLLPGSDMQVPEAHRWDTALRITGDSAEVHHLSADGARVRMPVEVSVDGSRLIAATPLPTPSTDETTLFAIVGIYDPFAHSGWRSVTRNPSPWSFSSETQPFPVVDLLAFSDAAQAAALQSGMLPLNNTPAGRGGVPWLLMMGIGLVVAVVGVALRSRVTAGDPEVVGPAALEATTDIPEPVLPSDTEGVQPKTTVTATPDPQLPSDTEGKRPKTTVVTVAASASDSGDTHAGGSSVPVTPITPAVETRPVADDIGGGAPIIIGRDGRKPRPPRARPMPPHSAAAPLLRPPVAPPEGAGSSRVSPAPPQPDTAVGIEDVVDTNVAPDAVKTPTGPVTAGASDRGPGTLPVPTAPKRTPRAKGIDDAEPAVPGLETGFVNPEWDADEVLDEPGEGRWSAAWRTPPGDDDDV